MQKRIQHNKDERRQFFRKIYLPLYLKGFERVTKGFTMWGVSWRLNRTTTHWPPLLSITAFLSRSPGLLNLGVQLLGDMVLIPASSLQLTRTSCAPSYIIVLRPLNSTCRQSILSPWYLRLDAPVIYTGAFPILTARLGSICKSYIYIYIYIYIYAYNDILVKLVLYTKISITVINLKYKTFENKASSSLTCNGMVILCLKHTVTKIYDRLLYEALNKLTMILPKIFRISVFHQLIFLSKWMADQYTGHTIH